MKYLIGLFFLASTAFAQIPIGPIGGSGSGATAIKDSLASSVYNPTSPRKVPLANLPAGLLGQVLKMQADGTIGWAADSSLIDTTQYVSMDRDDVIQGEKTFTGKVFIDTLFINALKLYPPTQWPYERLQLDRSNGTGLTYGWGTTYYMQATNTGLYVAGATGISLENSKIFGTTDGGAQLGINIRKWKSLYMGGTSYMQRVIADSAIITPDDSITFIGEAGDVINATAGNVFRGTLSQNDTLSISGMSDGQAITVCITNAGTYTLDWTGICWEGGVQPTLSAGANKKDVYTIIRAGSITYGAWKGDMR